MKQPWPPKEKMGTQVEPSALTRAPLPAPIPVAPLTDELEMPAVAKRVKNAGRKEWDCIIQRRAQPRLSQDVADDMFNPHTSPKKASRASTTPVKRQGSLSPDRLNATPGWHKRSPSRQKQVFLRADPAQPTNGLTIPNYSSPRKVSAMRLPTEGDAAALAEPGAVAGKKAENPEPSTFLRRIDRTNAFAKPEPIPPSKSQVQKNENLDDSTSGIFAGRRLRAIGEANCAALCQELERAGAVLINRNGAEVDFYVVRLAGYALFRSCECISLTVACSGTELMNQEASQDEHHKFRTECWVERCIFESRVCEVDENVTFRPLSIPTPLAGTASCVSCSIWITPIIATDASQLFVASSGLDLPEQTWVKRLLRVLGMFTYACILYLPHEGMQA